MALGVILALGACEAEGIGDQVPAMPGTPVGLSEDPVVVVGERPGDPAHELYAVRTPFLLPEGGLGVPLSKDATIRIYDANGEFVRSLGSEGQGPGEFVRLAAAWARGDTIEAFDSGPNRVTRFIPGRPPETVMLAAVSSAQSVAPGLDDGSWILYGVRAIRPTGRDVIAVHRFAPDGSYMGLLQEIEGFRRHEFPGGAGPDPISPRPVVHTEGNQVYVAETLSPRVMVTDVVRDQAWSIDWTPSGGISGTDVVEAARDALEGAGLSPGAMRWNLASFDALSGDEETPVFSDFLVDGEEFLWVRGYDPALHATHAGGLERPGPGGVWSVLGRDGVQVGEITMPADFEPLSIDGDGLLGVRRDALDVESVRVYRIERSAG